MWQALASLALNKINQNNADEDRRLAQIQQKKDALKSQNLAMQQQQQQERSNLDFQKFGQGVQNATNPILDDIMKKYGAGRYSR